MSKPKEKQKIGDVFEEICSRISCGELLCDLCKDYGFTRAWFWLWVNEDHARLDAYARARIEQQHAFADEILKIADDSSRDTKMVAGNDGEERPVADNEWLNRSRLRIDTRKFLMARIAAKDYGDKIQTELSGSVQTTQIVVHRGKSPNTQNKK